MRSAQVTGDPSNVGQVIGALVNASFGPNSDFLGPPAFQAFSSAILGKVQ